MKRALWLASVAVIVASPSAAEELKVPILPKSTTLAGSLIYEGRWYAMGSNEIACVNKLLAGKPWYKPDELAHITISLPPMNNRIVLWGQDNGRLVPTDVIEFDFRISLLYSQGKSHFYEATDSEEYKPLREMVERIRKGSERPVAVEPGKSALETAPAEMGPRNSVDTSRPRGRLRRMSR